MEVYVILYGCAAKPELSDEVKGYLYNRIDAQEYCDQQNEEADEGYAYWFETAPQLMV